MYDSHKCWAVLFHSLSKLLEEEEAKRVFLLVPHYNYTFVQFASTTIEEVPHIAESLGVTVDNVPRICACSHPAKLRARIHPHPPAPPASLAHPAVRSAQSCSIGMAKVRRPLTM